VTHAGDEVVMLEVEDWRLVLVVMLTVAVVEEGDVVIVDEGAVETEEVPVVEDAGTDVLPVLLVAVVELEVRVAVPPDDDVEAKYAATTATTTMTIRTTTTIMRLIALFWSFKVERGVRREY